jgi:hypothetical protein
MLGGVGKWTGLVADTPPFLVAAGARVLAVVMIVLATIFIDTSNYPWFASLAVLTAVLTVVSIVRFDRDRRMYVASVQEVSTDGSPLTNSIGQPVLRKLVIGTERELEPDAATAFAKARQKHGVSLERFMAGYGQAINVPTALWPREVLVAHSMALTTGLIYIVLGGVVSLFLAAIVLDVSGFV